MNLTVNGQPKTVHDGTTVAELLEQLKVQPERVVVEINLKILKRHEHAQTVVCERDQIEIVQVVGGG